MRVFCFLADFCFFTFEFPLIFMFIYKEIQCFSPFSAFLLTAALIPGIVILPTLQTPHNFHPKIHTTHQMPYNV